MRHEIQHDEVMAYLGVELSVKSAAAAADHIYQCEVCQGGAEDVRANDKRMNDWTVEEVTATVGTMIDGQPMVRARTTRRRLVWWMVPMFGLMCLMWFVSPSIWRAAKVPALVRSAPESFLIAPLDLAKTR